MTRFIFGGRCRTREIFLNTPIPLADWGTSHDFTGLSLCVSLLPLQSSGDDRRPQLISRHWRSGLSVIGIVGNDGGGDDIGEKVLVMTVVKEVAGVDNGRGGSIQLLVLMMLMVMAEVMEMGEGEARTRGRREEWELTMVRLVALYGQG